MDSEQAALPFSPFPVFTKKLNRIGECFPVPQTTLLLGVSYSSHALRENPDIWAMSSEANAIYFLALVFGRAECQMGDLGIYPAPWNITTRLNQKPQVMFTITSVGEELHARTVCREGQYITEQTFQSESVWTDEGETCYVTRVPL